jgi:hypothetical protein
MRCTTATTRSSSRCVWCCGVKCDVKCGVKCAVNFFARVMEVCTRLEGDSCARIEIYWNRRQLESCLNALCDCNYKEFFKVSVV